jgi:hypothetical protein
MESGFFCCASFADKEREAGNPESASFLEIPVAKVQKKTLTKVLMVNFATTISSLQSLINIQFQQ